MAVDAFKAQDPNQLIKQQYAQARGALRQQKQAAQDQVNMGVDRQAAISGLQGGSIMKAKENAQNTLEGTFGAQEAALGAEEASAQVKSGEFQQTYGLQKQQIDDARMQFNKEFDENQKTNIINASIALGDIGMNPQWMNNLRGLIGYMRGEEGLPVSIGGGRDVRTPLGSGGQAMAGIR